MMREVIPSHAIVICERSLVRAEGQDRAGVPADTMSALLTSVKEMTAGISSEVIPESTAAACSCATRERLPVRKILMIGCAQPALAMDTFETISDAEYSSQSAYLGRGKTRRGEHPHARQLGHQWGNQRTLGLRATRP